MVILVKKVGSYISGFQFDFCLIYSFFFFNKVIVAEILNIAFAQLVFQVIPYVIRLVLAWIRDKHIFTERKDSPYFFLATLASIPDSEWATSKRIFCHKKTFKMCTVPLASGLVRWWYGGCQGRMLMLQIETDGKTIRRWDAPPAFLLFVPFILAFEI